MIATDTPPPAEVRVADSLAEDESIPDPDTVSAWAAAAMDRANNHVSIRIVDAGEIKALNAKYRGKDVPTNVLAFSADLLEGVDDGFLGDLAICASVVAAEAHAQDKPLAAHWAHMVVHGVLHLQGHDHEASGPRREMEQREVEILAALGYEDPYQVRKKA